MNVLLFVTSILMLLALMTYARIDTFRSFSIVQSQFEHYIQNTERAYPNKQAAKLYNEIHVEEKEAADREKKENEDACSKLGFHIFLDKKEQKEKEKLHFESTVIAKNLMILLYSGQPFFDDMAKENPEFLDDILSRVTKVADKLPKGQKVKSVKDLTNLNLGDAQLNLVFYKMLHGNLKPQTPEEEKAAKKAAEKDLSKLKPAEGYPSFMDFITLKKDKTKIRLYLAPYLLLRAIVPEPNANNIINLREPYGKQIKAMKKQKAPDAEIDAIKKQAAQALQQAFEDNHFPNIDADIIDFSVSTTDPKPYRYPQ